MRIIGIVIALMVIVFGVRLITAAFKMAVSGKVIVRKGRRTHWEPAPRLEDAWGLAFRDGLLGLLFIALGIAILT